MPRSTALGSGADPLIWLGLAAATLFFLATGAVAYLNFQTLKRDTALVVRSGDTLTRWTTSFPRSEMLKRANAAIC